jgi:autotransporter translocation and assembly factor TamB
MKFRWLLLPISLLLILGLFFSFLVSSHFPEKFAFFLLQKALQKNNGRLTFETIQGNIKRGLTLKGVSFQNDAVSLKAESVTLRMRTTPLVFGIFSLKELTVEGANARIENTGGSGEKAGGGIPLWLTVYSRKTSINVDRLEFVDKANGSFIIENSKLESKFVIRLGRINFKNLKLGIEKSPLQKPLTFNGSLGFKPYKWLNLTGFFNFGRSRAKVAASFNQKKNGPSLNAEIKEASIFLRDLSAFADFPDLILTGSSKLSFENKRLTLKTQVEEKGYGKFSITSVGTISGDSIKGEGTVAAKPFYYSLGISQIKSDKLKISGDFKAAYEYDLKDRSLNVTLKGNVKDSVALDIPFESSRAEVTLKQSKLHIVSDFASPIAGTGDVDITYDFKTEVTNVKLRAASNRSKACLDTLGIDVPLPYPLKFTEARLKIDEGTLIFDGAKISIEMLTGDESAGRYGIKLSFSDFELETLSLDLEKIDPKLWQLDAPFKFTGRLDFDWSTPNLTKALLTTAYFDFGRLVLGPVNTTLELLPSGKLLVPPARVPFAGGSADVQGELDDKGNYKGKAKLLLTSFESVPIELPESLKGSVSSDFSFDGDFSMINLYGELKADSIMFSENEISQVEIKGKAHVQPSKNLLDLECNISLFKSPYAALGNSVLKVKGDLISLIYEASSEFGKNSRINFSGSASLGKNEIAARIDKGTLQLNEKALNFSGHPEIICKDKTISWKELDLSNGESIFTSQGNIDLAAGAGNLNAEAVFENFSIPFFPLPHVLSRLKGKIDGALKIRGKTEAPRIEGELLFKNLAYPLPDSDIKVTGLATLVFGNSEVKFKNCSFSTNEGGEAAITGKIGLQGLKINNFSLSLDGQDLPVVYGRDFAGLIDIGIKLTGNYDEPRLEGNILILKGKLQLKEQSVSSELPSSIVFLNTKAGSLKEVSGPAFSVEKLRGGILITSNGKLWISRRDIIAELGGKVLVKFTKNGISPEGNLNLLGGRFLFQGTKFELKDSTLYFSVGAELLPLLDIKASKQVGDYEVTANLQGPSDKPTLSLSSIPPLEQGDILSLILFGRPSQKLSPEENARWGGAAAAIAFSYQAAPLMNSVAKALKVDTLQVGTSSTGDAQIGFSRYLSDRFVLEYEQTFGALPEGRLNLRYRVNRHLSLETNSSTIGKSGADVIWEQKY